MLLKDQHHPTTGVGVGGRRIRGAARLDQSSPYFPNKRYVLQVTMLLTLYLHNPIISTVH